MRKTKVQSKIASGGIGHAKHIVLNAIHSIFLNGVIFVGATTTARKAFIHAES